MRDSQNPFEVQDIRLKTEIDGAKWDDENLHMIKQAVKTKQDYTLVLADEVSKNVLSKALADLGVTNTNLTRKSDLKNRLIDELGKHHPINDAISNLDFEQTLGVLRYNRVSIPKSYRRVESLKALLYKHCISNDPSKPLDYLVSSVSKMKILSKTLLSLIHI